MKSRTQERLLAFSQQTASDALLDYASWTHWRPGLLAVTTPSDARILVGSAWVEERSLESKPLRMSATAIAVDSPRAFSYRLAGDGLEAVFRWTIHGDADGAVVAQETLARATNWGSRLTGLAERFLLQQEASLDLLQRHLRGRPSAPSRRGGKP